MNIRKYRGWLDKSQVLPWILLRIVIQFMTLSSLRTWNLGGDLRLNGVCVNRVQYRSISPWPELGPSVTERTGQADGFTTCYQRHLTLCYAGIRLFDMHLLIAAIEDEIVQIVACVAAC